MKFSEEWRFVVVDGQICASSSYEAETRQGTETKIPTDVRAFADEVVTDLDPPEPVYILDIGRTKNGSSLGLVELNPFSGADLYSCNYAGIVHALAEYIN